MKPIIIEMKDLSESTEIYEKKPNPAIVGFIYILLGIIVIAALWMSFSKIDVVTETNGVICYTEDVTEVMCDYDGRITRCCVADGQYVTEGTVLFELKKTKKDKDEKTEKTDKTDKTEDLAEELPVIRASENGYFYATFLGETGAAVTSESRVGYIFPKEQKTFQAQIIVLATDIEKVHEGQQVQLEVDAFPASEYGTITGYVRKIMDEAQYGEESGISYFPVWIEFDATELVGKNDKITPLRSGLSCRAKIVTEQRRVLPYVWESIR